MRRTISALVIALAMALGACATGTISDTPDDTDSTTTTRVVQSSGSTGLRAFAASGLEPFDSCSDFLDYVTGHALDRVGPYGLDGYGGDYRLFDVDEAVSADSTAESFPQATYAGSGPVKGVDYSGTNVQVTAIDEPDVVKTDGERIFVVAQGELHWIDATGTPEIVASMPLDGWGQELFLSGDHLLVMTSDGGYGSDRFIDRGVSFDDRGSHSQRVVLTEVDVSNPSSMETVRTLMIDGSILSSRMTDGSIRVVVQSRPVGFDWVYPEGSGIRAEQDAIEANKALIEDSTLENWVPWYMLKDSESGTTSDGPLLGCDQTGHPEEFSGLSMMTVLSIDLDEGLEPSNSIGLLAEGQTMYASQANLYVATSPWRALRVPLSEDDIDKNETFLTQIHVFDTTDRDATTYVASGEVEGTLLSQWSMDEYEGTLRVVVTDENPWWGSADVPDTAVVTMERRGDELVAVGSVDGLGKNERVYAVRFIEDKGYVVTFREVDPLYVVDLSDPTKPEVTGELKINGYSAYLHPIGDDLLLGVGQDATDEGRTLGTQISVFDVSDPTDPRRLSRMIFEEAYSDAEWDHHAFLWWAPEEISVLPLQRWSWDQQKGTEDYFSGAAVLKISPQRVKQVGEIRHPGYTEDECEDCGEWSAPITRSLVIGDTLFTFSETGALASDLGSLEDVTWMAFDS
jgi:hypothetical protein